jgi:hypothetical protein
MASESTTTSNDAPIATNNHPTTVRDAFFCSWISSSDSIGFLAVLI